MAIPTQNCEVKGHVVVAALPFWGHNKPLCALLARQLRMRRIRATFLTRVDFRDRVITEIDRQFLEGEDELKSLIRVIGVPGSERPFDFDLYRSRLVDAYRLLWDCVSIPQTPESELLYEPLERPQLVLLDFFCYEVLKGIRAISGTELPIYAWQSCSTAAILVFGPESIGGHGDLRKKYEAIDAEDEEEWKRKVISTYRRLNNQLVRTPGLPDMYAHEHAPQEPAIANDPVEVAKIGMDVFKFFEECDGVVHCTSAHLERIPLEAFQSWLEPRPNFAVSSLSPPVTTEEIEKEKAKSPVAGEVEDFLNKSLVKYGPNSVVYISFGTIWWSSEPEKIWAVLDVLMEEGIPFLLGHNSPVAVIPDELDAKMKASGSAYHATWLPQQMILHHEACGWIVTHCGHNSVMESLQEGVPLICWPFDADQPANAATISWMHAVGYELFEVRNGHGLLPIRRLRDKKPTGTVEAIKNEFRSIMKLAFGYDGDLKRAKAQWFAEQLTRGWEPDGESTLAVKKVFELVG